MPRIALIHAGPVSIEPVERAFAHLWPAADIVNLMDDALMVDRARTAELTPALASRIARLGGYARDLGADGILYTCSAFGPAIEAVQRAARWPVLKPNEAMFEAALAAGSRIGMVASFPKSLPTMEQEFHELARSRGSNATIRAVAEPAALEALQRGDVDAHNRLLADAAVRLGTCDVVMLAQFSTSRATDAVRARVSVPVMSPPDAAVVKMKSLLAG